MVNIGIFEDDKNDSKKLYDELINYQQNLKTRFDIDIYSDPVEYFEKGQKQYDIIFFDIRMPSMSGMEAANCIRQKDDKVVIIFTTTIADYALEGYGVNAFDYILKPVDSQRLSMTLNKVINKIENEKELVLNVKTSGGFTCVAVNEIKYVEVKDHLLYYHLNDREVSTWKSLKSVEKELPEDRFVRCNKHIIVNLAHVRTIEGNSLWLKTGEEFVCTSRRKDVMSALNSYLGS